MALMTKRSMRAVEGARFSGSVAEIGLHTSRVPDNVAEWGAFDQEGLARRHEALHHLVQHPANRTVKKCEGEERCTEQM